MARTRSQAISPSSHVSLETDRAPRQKRTATAPKQAGVGKASQSTTANTTSSKRGRPKKGGKGRKKSSDEESDGDEMDLEADTSAPVDEASSNNNNQSEHNISSMSDPMDIDHELGEAQDPGNSALGHTTSTSEDFHAAPSTPDQATGPKTPERSRSELAEAHILGSTSSSPLSPSAVSPQRSRTDRELRSLVSESSSEEDSELDLESTESEQLDVTSPSPGVSPTGYVAPQSESTEESSHISSVLSSPTSHVSPQLEPTEEPSHVSSITSSPHVVSPTSHVSPQEEPTEEPSHVSPPASPTPQWGRDPSLSPGAQLEAELWQHFEDTAQAESAPAVPLSQLGPSSPALSESSSYMERQDPRFFEWPLFEPVDPALRAEQFLQQNLALLEASASNGHPPISSANNVGSTEDQLSYPRAIEVRRVVVPHSSSLLPTPAPPMENQDPVDQSIEDISMQDIPAPTEFELAFPDYNPLRVPQILEICPELRRRYPHPEPEDIRPREEALRAWILEHPPQHEDPPQEEVPPSPADSQSSGERYIASLHAAFDEDVRQANANDSSLSDPPSPVGDSSFDELDSLFFSPPHASDHEGFEDLIRHTTQPSVSPQAVAQPTVTSSSISPLPSNSEGSPAAPESVSPTPQISFTPPTVSEAPTSHSSISSQPTTLGTPQDSVRGYDSAARTIPSVAPSARHPFQSIFEAAQPARAQTSVAPARSPFPLVPASEDSQRTATEPSPPPEPVQVTTTTTSMATQTSPGLAEPVQVITTSMATQTSPGLANRYSPYCRYCATALVCPNGHSPRASPKSSPRQAVPKKSPRQVGPRKPPRQVGPKKSPRQAEPKESPQAEPRKSPRQVIHVPPLHLYPAPPRRAPPVARPLRPTPMESFREILAASRREEEMQSRDQQLTRSPVASRKRARNQANQDDDSPAHMRPQKRRATGSSSGTARSRLPARRLPTSSRPQTLSRRQPSTNGLFRRGVSYEQTRRRVAAESQGRVHTSSMFRLPELIAQNDADRRAAAEVQGLQGFQNPVVPQPERQPVEPEPSTTAPSEEAAPTPETPRAGWGLRNIFSKFIPRFGTVREQPVEDTAHVSQTTESPARVSQGRTSLVRTSPDRVSPEATRRQQGDGAARPRSVPMDVGARPTTVTPIGQQERMQNPQDLTYSLFSAPIDKSSYLRAADASPENGVVNAATGRSCQAPTGGDKPKSLKKRKRSSLKEIPNPPGTSYGMDLDYFCFSSESEEEGEMEEDEEQAGKTAPKGILRSPKPAAKRVRFDKSPKDTPSRLRATAPVPGPHGSSEIPVEAESQTPTPVTVAPDHDRPVIPNQHGTFCVEYSNSSSSNSAGSPTPPPPSAVARGKQSVTAEVAPEPQPSLSEPLLLPSPPPTAPTMPRASTQKSHPSPPTLSGGLGFGLVRDIDPTSVVVAPTAWDLESRDWDEEMAIDDDFSRDALWMYQQCPSGDFGALPWPKQDNYANSVGTDTVVDRLVGEVWNEQRAQTGFGHFGRDFERFKGAGEELVRRQE